MYTLNVSINFYSKNTMQLQRFYIVAYIQNTIIICYVYFSTNLLKGLDNKEYHIQGCSILLNLHSELHTKYMQLARKGKAKYRASVFVCRQRQFKEVIMGMMCIRIILLLAAYCLLPWSVDAMVRHYKFNVRALFTIPVLLFVIVLFFSQI